MTTLIDLIGAADNLGEEEPLLNRRSVILGIVILSMVVKWICALARFYTRFFIIRSPWWDDLFVMLSLLSTQLGSSFVCVMPNVGLGQHFVLLTQKQIQNYLWAFWVANATYPCSTALIKIALLLQYLRMYDRDSKLRVFAIATLVVTTLWGLGYGVLAWVPTVPISAYWNIQMPAARYAYGSVDATTFVATYESHTAINMFLDVVVLALAVPIFMKRDLRKHSYLGLLVLFCLGGIVNVFSIWRLASIVTTRAATKPTFDPTWYAATPIVVACMEADLATVCASLPVFWPIIKQNVAFFITVTHEVKITREQRHNSSATDSGRGEDYFELHHPLPSNGTSKTSSGDFLPMQPTRRSADNGIHFSVSVDNPVQPFSPFGTVTSMTANCKRQS